MSRGRQAGCSEYAPQGSPFPRRYRPVTLQSDVLKSDGVGLLGAVTFGVVMLSPAMTIYGNFGPAFVAAGHAATLAFVLALLATLPTAVSYALLSRDCPSAGSAADWMAKATSDTIGTWAGWITFSYYFNNYILQPITLGVFLGDLLTILGIHPGYWSFGLGAVLCTLWPARIAYRGITHSTRGAFGFLLFESLVVVLLCATVAWVVGQQAGASALTLRGFTLAGSPEGSPGIFRAMIFGLLAFCGFDVISTLSEEAKLSRRMIPQATFWALGTFGLFIIGGVWILTHAVPLDVIRRVTAAGGMPITQIAQQYWGRWAVLIPLTAISASLGIAIATSVGASRVLFSMGRAGLAPRQFSALHPRFQVPWNAMHLIFAGGLLAALLTAAVLGPYNTFVFWGTTSTFFAMLTYLMVHFANLILFRARARSSLRGFFLHALVPLFGIAVDLYILIRAFLIELWNQGWASGRAAIVFDVGWAIVFALAALWRTRRKAPAPSDARQ